MRKNFNPKILAVVLILMIFGIIMIASAGAVYSQTRFGDQYFFFKRQLLYGFLPGLIILYIFQKIDYHFWKKISFLFFISSLILLSLIFIPGIGVKIYGASRWIDLGLFSFQPSEMAKISIIIYLAAWLESRGLSRIRDFYEGFLPFLVITGIVGFLLINQPDVGTLGIIVLTTLSIFFLAGARLSHFLMLGFFILLSFLLIVKTASYRVKRLIVFLNPETDVKGIGYQINQALLAIGSGGLWGVGLGYSRQKFNYLPEPVGDSIFAIIAEELGLVGASILLALFVFFAVQGFKVAKKAPDLFGRLLAGGITSWIIIQVFVNICSITSLIPLTGVPLPFISYGGTSMIFLLAGVGILLNISKYAKN